MGPSSQPTAVVERDKILIKLKIVVFVFEVNKSHVGVEDISEVPAANDKKLLSFTICTLVPFL